jgi:putative nucleotidyltransferase with HDIG domain
MSHDPKKTIKSITHIIKTDQGLAAEVLRLANSPFYSFVNCIDSIDRAIVLLGFDEIKRLITAIKIRPFFEKNFKYYNESGFRIWLHSFNVAKMCYNVARSYNNIQINKESIYLAGLMHDIGKTVLVSYLQEPVFDPTDEKVQTGYTHMEAGAIILRHWNLTENIIDAVLNHHAISSKLFNRILYFANKRERIDKINNKLKEDIDTYFGFTS